MPVSITSNGGGATGAANITTGATAATTVQATRTSAFTYSIAGGANQALFTINSSTGALAFAEAQPIGTYEVIVRATDADSSLTGDQLVTVSVTESIADARFIGNGVGAALLTNLAMSSLTTGVNESDEVVFSFVAQGSRIDAARIFWIYTQGDSGYSKGDGGTANIELYAYDPVTKWRTGSALGSTGNVVCNTRYWTQSQAAAKYPGAIWSQHGETGTRLWLFRLLDFTSPVTVVPGQAYCLRIYPTNADKADHYVSVEGLRNRHLFLRTTNDPSFDPHREYRVSHSRDGVVYDRSSHNAFGLTAVMEIVGDQSFGFATYQSPNTTNVGGDIDRTLNVDGTKRCRQVWTPAQAFTLKSVHVAGGRNSGSADLTVQIKQSGSTLATVALSGYPLLAQPTDLVTNIHNAAQWRSAALSDVPVVANVPVYVELSTTAGTDYEITGSLDGQKVGYFTSGGFPEGNAQYTLNGSTWVNQAAMDIAVALVGEVAP